MSIGTPQQIIDRIKSAEPDSPIAVFNLGDEAVLDAVFGSTVKAHQRLATENNLVGVWHRHSNLTEAREAMRRILTENIERRLQVTVQGSTAAVWQYPPRPRGIL